MNGELPKAEAACLAFIADELRRSGGVSPSYREIAAGLGCATSHAHCLVDELEARGLVTRLAGKSRALTVVGVEPHAAPPSVEASLATITSAPRSIRGPQW